MTDVNTPDAGPASYDVFISYAHDDNNKLVDETVGWVEQFEKDFEVTLQEQLGRQPKIWRDSDITPNEDFEKKIFSRLAKSVIFLPVLSRIFVNRPYCLRELRTFAENAAKQLATYIDSDGERKRIFIVEKLPVARDRLPTELQGLGGTFKFHDDDQTLRPALSSKGSLYRDLYYKVLNRLSKTAADLIQLAASSAEVAGEPSGTLSVYLAETTSDAYEQREALRDDLIDRGFQVLPELELPREIRKYTEAVKSCLARAVMSVHIVGREYGYIPEGERELSNVRLQHQLALERSEQSPAMSQIIWLANGSEGCSDTRQRDFIDYLETSEKVHAHAELIEGSIESLKTDLLEKLTKFGQKAEEPEAAAPHPDHPRVYIIHHQLDRSSEQLKALKTYLFEQGCETRLSTVEGTAEEMRKAHEQKLEGFDAFVIYAGAGGDAWLEAQLDDFHQFLRNRTKKVFAKAVYLAPPHTSAKDELETHEAAVLQAGDAFEPKTVELFLRLCGKPAANRS